MFHDKFWAWLEHRGHRQHGIKQTVLWCAVAQGHGHMLVSLSLATSHLAVSMVKDIHVFLAKV